MTKVVFRKWKDTGSIIALFPDEPWKTGVSKHLTSSYEHIGQHGGADYHHVVDNTTPATESEYANLLAELKSIGYDDINVLKRGKPKYDKR